MIAPHRWLAAFVTVCRRATALADTREELVAMSAELDRVALCALRWERTARRCSMRARSAERALAQLEPVVRGTDR